MEYLLIQNTTSVTLTGYLDDAERLQLSHTAGNLVDYDNALQAEHPTATTIQVKVMDFTEGSTTWTVNASHEAAGGSVNWSRGTDHAYYDFSEYMSNFLAVTVTASDGSSNKEKIIDIRTKPEGSLPDDGV